MQNNNKLPRLFSIRIQYTSKPFHSIAFLLISRVWWKIKTCITVNYNASTNTDKRASYSS